MAEEPLLRQPGDLFQGARLGEQMGGARNDIESPLAPQQGIGRPVQVHHDLVVSSHDQERGSSDQGKRLASQVRPPSPGDDCGEVA